MVETEKAQYQLAVIQQIPGRRRDLPVFFVAVNSASLRERDGEVTKLVVVHELLAALVTHVPVAVHAVADLALPVECVSAPAPQENLAVAAVRGHKRHFAGVWN
jgi:hypothetical protein